MENLTTQLQEQASGVIKELFPEADSKAAITQSTNPQFGHYSNAGLIWKNRLKFSK